jgi:hypothetical protein
MPPCSGVFLLGMDVFWIPVSNYLFLAVQEGLININYSWKK